MMSDETFELRVRDFLIAKGFLKTFHRTEPIDWHALQQQLSGLDFIRSRRIGRKTVDWIARKVIKQTGQPLIGWKIKSSSKKKKKHCRTCTCGGA